MNCPIRIERAALTRDAGNPTGPIRLEIAGVVDTEWTRTLAAEARRRLSDALASVVSGYQGSEADAKLSRVRGDLETARESERNAKLAAVQAERALNVALESGADQSAAELASTKAQTNVAMATDRRKRLESVHENLWKAQQANLVRELDGARLRVLDQARSDWQASLSDLASAVAERFGPCNVAEFAYAIAKDASCIDELLLSLGFDRRTTYTPGHGYPVKSPELQPDGEPDKP